MNKSMAIKALKDAVIDRMKEINNAYRWSAD